MYESCSFVWRVGWVAISLLIPLGQGGSRPTALEGSAFCHPVIILSFPVYAKLFIRCNSFTSKAKYSKKAGAPVFGAWQKAHTGSWRGREMHDFCVWPTASIPMRRLCCLRLGSQSVRTAEVRPVYGIYHSFHWGLGKARKAKVRGFLGFFFPQCLGRSSPGMAARLILSTRAMLGCVTARGAIPSTTQAFCTPLFPDILLHAAALFPPSSTGFLCSTCLRLTRQRKRPLFSRL